MGPKNGNIRDYFQFSQPPVVAQPATVASALHAKEKPILKSNIIKSSDDEESGSDSSLEDITELFGSKTSARRVVAHTPITPVKHERTGRYKTLHTSPLPKLPKYKFDLKTLASEAQKHEAAEARAMRMKALQEEDDAAAETKAAQVSDDGLLESIIADRQDGDMDKVMRAVQRTEAIRTETRWYFFQQSEKDTACDSPPFPVQDKEDGWQHDLLDSSSREQTIFSGFARDMVLMGDCLPDEMFLWMLDALCFENRDDLRQAYCDIILAAPSQALRLMQPPIVGKMFRNLGARLTAVEMDHTLRPVPANLHLYIGKQWVKLRTVLCLLGQISQSLPTATNCYTISLMFRLCADPLVLDNAGVLSTLQESLMSLSNAVEAELWPQQCLAICTSLFTTIKQATLRSRVLQCLPASTIRMHALRRSLALAFLFEDLGRDTTQMHQTIDLWEITKLLDGPRFKISESTDYYELAALMTILDIAIDNGSSDDVELANPDMEYEFNADVDALAQRVKAMWSSINDSGTSFISRIDAKEVMEGVRHRLIYAVRTKTKPKRSVFDSAIVDDTEQTKKQSAMMSRYFAKPRLGVAAES